MTQSHVEPPPITLIKGTYDGKSEKYSIKMKFHKDPMSSTLDLYEFRMSLFDNVETEEFLLFVLNFNMTLAASGTLEVMSSENPKLKQNMG